MEDHIPIIIADYIDDFKLKPYKLTIKLHQDILYQKVEDYYLDLQKINETNDDVVDDDDYHLILRNTFEECLIKYINEEHIEKYAEVEIDRINKIEVPEQRTKEWHEQRMKYITASECAYAMGIKGNSTKISTLLKKLGIPSSGGTGDACIHGILLEDSSVAIYESRYQVKISEYGCLPHPTIDYLAASPDGIITNISNPDNLEQISKAYRMIEIKNPYSRKIDGVISKDYSMQMQLQMQVARLPLCEFIETDINKEHYEDLDELLNDVINVDELDDSINIDDYIKNHNIPISNLASDGQEKGVLIYLKKNATNPDERDSHIGINYPIHIPYKKDEINKWIIETKREKEKDGYSFITFYAWKLNNISIQTIEKDDEFWDNEIFIKLKQYWDDVERLRKLNDEDLVKEYPNQIMLDNEVELNNMKRRKISKITKIYKEKQRENKELIENNKLNSTLEGVIINSNESGEIINIRLSETDNIEQYRLSEIIHKETKKKTYNKRGNYKKQVFCRFPPD